MSLSCSGLCHHKEFKEKFKVLRQLSGKIKHQIRRFYRYCSRCTIFLKGLKNCSCCGLQLRKKITDKRARINKRYYETHKESCKARCKAWQQAHKGRKGDREKYLAYQRAYYYSHKK